MPRNEGVAADHFVGKFWRQRSKTIDEHNEIKEL